jgi:hypothetical protein
MAKVSDNMLITGLRGKLGRLFVFRIIRGETIVSHAPRKPDKSKETELQRRTRTTFRDASRWAKIEVRDPEKKKHYQACARDWGVTSAYTAAIKDYMSDPPARKES